LEQIVQYNLDRMSTAVFQQPNFASIQRRRQT